MATSKTLTATNVTMSIPEMTDAPNASVFSADVGALGDAANKNTSTGAALGSSLAIVSTGDTHVAISSGQYVYVKSHGTLSEGLYTANAAISANASLTSSNLTAVSGGGLNSLNSNIANLSSKFVYLNTDFYITKTDKSVTLLIASTATLSSDGKTFATTLPEEYRPKYNAVFFGKVYNNSEYVDCTISISPSGVVTVGTMYGTAISGIGISYLKPNYVTYYTN